MLNRWFRKSTGRSLLVEVNPHQILVVGINRPRRGPVLIEFAAEFARADAAALRAWLDGRKELRRHWLTVIGGFVAQRGIIQRESLKAADLKDPEQIVATVRDHQVRHSTVSSSPFRDLDPQQWTFRAVNAANGHPLPDDNVVRPALLVGVANAELHEIQQQLLDARMMPQQLEPALLPLFGALYQIMEQRRYARAVVVVVLREDTSTVYILGKEGVHTPGTVAHGLNAVVKQVRKEFALETDEAALHRLMGADDELRRRARKLLRGLATELRPALDSYEMTTGQPIGDVYCPYLPPALAWLAEPLVRGIDREQLAVDCHEWMALAGLQPGPDVPAFDPHWLGVLSLVGSLPNSGDGAITRGITGSERPWHVDCRRSIESPGARWVGRQFLAGTAAAALLVLSLTATIWQAYATRSLQEDTAYWNEQMASNQALVAEMTGALANLHARTIRIGHAYRLMQQPYQMTEFLMELGRIMPPRLRIDRIEANETRVLLTGSLLEPAEEASLSLGRYRETLRRAPGIGGLFSSITATSLQRESNADTLMFEITLRLKSAP